MSCGLNDFGQLGHGDCSNRNIFEEIKGIPRNISDVACGDHHTIIKLTDGMLMSCGYNKFGQLGHGDNKDKYTFVEIKSVPRNVSRIWCGYNRSFIKIANRTSRGSTLMSCGSNSAGELGLGNYEKINYFKKIEVIPEGDISSMLCDETYTLIKFSSGILMSSGIYRSRYGRRKDYRSATFTIVTPKLS